MMQRTHKADFDYPYSTERTAQTGTTVSPFGIVFVSTTSVSRDRGGQHTSAHFSPEAARKFALDVLRAADAAEAEAARV